MARHYTQGDSPIPGYRLIKFLGRGGFGEVWKATAPGGLEVAMKFINLSGKPGQKELRSLQVVRQLRHPNLIPVTAYWLRDEEGHVLPDPVEQEMLQKSSTGKDVHSTNKILDTMVGMPDTLTTPSYGRPSELIIAMGLADTSLFDRLQECQRKGLPGLPQDELMGYMEDAAKAIDYLNSPTHKFMGESEPMSVQHCDIKPHNILIISGAAQVCDFGLARVMGDVQNSSAAAGTIAYAAPECIKEGKPSSTTDQYSLAISYLELKTGALPYDSETWMEVLAAVQDGNLNLSKLPPAEQAIIKRATAHDPADRFATCVAMVQALRRAVEGNDNPHLNQDVVNALHGTARDIHETPSLRGTAMASTYGKESDILDDRRPRHSQSYPPPPPSNPLAAIGGLLVLVSMLGAGVWFFFLRDDSPSGNGISLTNTKDPKTPITTPDPDPTKPEIPPTHQEIAAQLAKAGKFDEAVKAYNLAVVESPREAKLYFARGISFMKQDLYSQAVADFNQVKSISPDSELLNDPDVARTYHLHGEQLLKDGVFEAAKTAYSEAIALQGDKAPAAAFFGRGKCLLREQKLAEALADFMKAEKLEPSYPNPYSRAKEYALAFAQRAENTLESGKLDDAYRDAAKAVEIDSQNALAYLVKGTIKLMQGDNPNALKELALSIKFNDQEPRPYSRRGFIHLREGDFESAIFDLSYAIKLDPDPNDLKNRGLAYLNSEKYDRAITDFDASLVELPDDAFVYYYRAECFREQGLVEKSMADYAMAIKKDPTYPAPHVSRGFILGIQSKHKEAADEYTQALKLGYDDPKYLFELRADSFMNTQQSDFAKRDLELALHFGSITQNPTNAQKRAEIAFQLATDKDPPYQLGKVALRLAQEACELTKNSDGASLDALAAAHASLGNFDEALKAIALAISKASSAQQSAYQARQKLYEQKQAFVSP